MVELLEELSNLSGVSGNEGTVRDFIISRITPYADEISVDGIGSVIAFKKGNNSGRTLLLSAHMDEVGFIISGITEDGFLKFKSVGKCDTRNIISKCVKINDSVDGIIGMKAIHLQKKDERESTVAVKDLFIDIGAKSKKAAQKRVKLGDYVSFTTKAFRLGNNICGKAIDGRAGCACLIELMKHEYDDDIYFVFTAQREVGMRGAFASVYDIKADAALVIEGTETADMYGVKDSEKSAELGKGVCISLVDEKAILNPQLTEKLKAALEKAKVDVQIKRRTDNLSDTGAVQQVMGGRITVSVALPVRYAHTPCVMTAETDINALLKVANVFIGKVEF